MITASDGPSIRETGIPARKRPATIYLSYLTQDTVVLTDSGALVGEAGGFVAYDPISGHVWPLSRTYVEQHYDVEDVIDVENGAAL